MATPWTSLTEKPSESGGWSSLRFAVNLFRELGHVMERFWIIYEAMLRGTPIPDSDDVLSQIETALRRAVHVPERSRRH
jgi:hypothetical protein